jgi:hypothetical protein
MTKYKVTFYMKFTRTITAKNQVEALEKAKRFFDFDVIGSLKDFENGPTYFKWKELKEPKVEEVK